MTAPVKGVDVSSWQHVTDQPIDWQAVRDSGIAFALVKATQGVSYVNPWLARDLDGARVAGLLVGAYHFAEAGSPGDAQGAHFVSQLVGQVLELGCWIDWELGVVPDWEVSALYGAMLGAIEDARPGVGVYCGASWLETFRRLNLTVRRLWLVDDGTGVVPPDATILQYGEGTVPGIDGAVDLDALSSVRGFNRAPAPHPAPVAPVTAPVAPDVAETTSAVAEEREAAIATAEASAAE